LHLLHSIKIWGCPCFSKIWLCAW